MDKRDDASHRVQKPWKTLSAFTTAFEHFAPFAHSAYLSLVCKILGFTSAYAKQNSRQLGVSMGRTKTEMAEAILQLSNELQSISSGLSEVLGWIENGENPKVISGALEHHPHLIAVIALRGRALAEDLKNQVADETTELIVNKIRL